MENTVEKPSGSKDTGEKASASSSSATTVAKVETSAKGQDRATSSSTTEKGDGICLVCALGTKGSHTYQKECKRFVAGATMEQMKRAARGGRKGHHRLLLELALQRSDAERDKAEERKAPPGRGESSSSTSSSSSSTSSPRAVQKRTSTKRKRERPEEKEKIKNQAENGTAKRKTETNTAAREQPPSTTTKRKTETNTATREDSPDMVQEILGWQASSKRETEQAPTARTKIKEDDRSKKNIPSANTKEKKPAEVAKEEGKPRVPPPASARVDESKIDELAIARLEAARKEQEQKTAEKNPGSENLRMETDKETTVQMTRGKGQEREEKKPEEEGTRHVLERPASPMTGRRDSHRRRVYYRGDRDRRRRRRREGQGPKERMAEPAHAPSHVELQQMTYLVLWFQKEEEEHRKRWERNWKESQRDKDEEELAKRLQRLDGRIGEGTAYAEIQRQLQMLREQEAED